MSDQQDDIIGRALGRAIGSQSVRETPYGASRLARRLDRPPQRGWTYFLPIAAALALFVAMGAFFYSRGPQGVATPDASATPAAASATPPAAGTSGPAVATPRPVRVYFARDGLPPVAGVVTAPGGASTGRPDSAIGDRLSALFHARPDEVPSGTFNAAGLGLVSGTTSVSVRVEGDLATAEIGTTSGWPARGAAQSLALLQQLVYTITEEPGIRRAMITDKGKQTATIDQLVIDRPLTREEVFGYAKGGNLQPVRGFGEDGGPLRKATATYSVESIRVNGAVVSTPGLTRFVVEVAQPSGEPQRLYPDWSVSVVQNDESKKPNGGKWLLTVQIQNGTATSGFEAIDRTPLRSITTATGKGPGTTLIYELALDDLRPWRTALLFDPVRIVVDIGGHPGAVQDRNAVYLPRPGDSVGRAIQVSGVASAFEANVAYRVRDAQGRIVTSGATTATNCCEPGGVFDVTVQIPPEVPAGRITLEVYQASARDGSDLSLISIPLTIR